MNDAFVPFIHSALSAMLPSTTSLSSIHALRHQWQLCTLSKISVTAAVRTSLADLLNMRLTKALQGISAISESRGPRYCQSMNESF